MKGTKDYKKRPQIFFKKPNRLSRKEKKITIKKYFIN